MNLKDPQNDCQQQTLFQEMEERIHSGDSGHQDVYFIQQGEAGPIKIGVAKSISARLANLQSANSQQLRVIGMIPGGGREKERELHGRFHKYRLSGEWFEARPEILEVISEKAAGAGERMKEQPSASEASAANKKIRVALGLSQSQLARLTGVSRYRIHTAEHGDTYLTADEERKIREALQAEAARRLEAAEGVLKQDEHEKIRRALEAEASRLREGVAAAFC